MIRARYDKGADVLYLAMRQGVPAYSEEDLPGVMWRYSVTDNTIVGVTVMDYEGYWKSRNTDLLNNISSHLSVSQNEIGSIINKAYAG